MVVRISERFENVPITVKKKIQLYQFDLSLK